MNRSLSFSKIIVFLAVALGAAGSVSAQEFITNGSLTGPISNGGLPPGWTILAPSPDTMDENNNVGVGTGAPFGIAPSGPSPDGGTWVGFAADGSFREIFGQTVTGLTVGEEYEISWYAGNFGALAFVGTNAINVSVNGSSIGSGGVLPLASSWTAESLFFTATATSHDLSFGLFNADKAYLSIDGISLTATAAPPPPTSTEPVPIPTLSQWALIMLSMLLGLMVFANRKRLF